MGTAGRGPDFAKMSKDIYRRTFQKAKDVITNVFKLELGAVELVSGGAAWSGEGYNYMQQNRCWGGICPKDGRGHTVCSFLLKPG